MDYRKKRAPMKLKESEALYRTLFDHGDDGFILLEPVFDGAGKACDFRFLKVNLAYERQTGRKADVVEGKMAKEVAPDLEQEWISLIGEVVKSGKSVRYENYNARTSRWYDAHYFPWAKGQVGILFRDITERKKAAQSLITKQQELKTILDSSPTIIFYKDKDGKIIQANKAFAEALNVSRESLLGKTVFDLYSDEIAQAMTNDDLEVMASKRPKLGIVEPYESPTGIRWIRTDKIPSFDENGEVTGLIGFSEDITERKRMEDALRESKKKYQDLIETNYDFIWEMDSLGRYTYCSPQMEKLWGIKPAEMIGKTPFDVMPPSEKKESLERFKEMANSPKSFSGLQTTAYDSQNRLVFLEISLVPFFDDQGRLLGYRGITRDITERKKAEKDLQRQASLIDLSPDAIIVITVEGTITFWNKGAEKLYGWTKEEAVAKTAMSY